MRSVFAKTRSEMEIKEGHMGNLWEVREPSTKYHSHQPLPNTSSVSAHRVYETQYLNFPSFAMTA
jgi:hypothetical protein